MHLELGLEGGNWSCAHSAGIENYSTHGGPMWEKGVNHTVSFSVLPSLFVVCNLQCALSSTSGLAASQEKRWCPRRLGFPMFSPQLQEESGDRCLIPMGLQGSRSAAHSKRIGYCVCTGHACRRPDKNNGLCLAFASRQASTSRCAQKLGDGRWALAASTPSWRLQSVSKCHRLRRLPPSEGSLCGDGI